MLSKAKIYFKLFIQNGSVCSQGLQFVYVGWSKKLWHAEKGIRALLFLAKLTSNKMDLKEERLQNTYRSQGNLGPCSPGGAHALKRLRNCISMLLTASICHSSWAFSSSPHIFVSQSIWEAPFCILPCTFFFALPMERNAHCSIFAGKDQKLWEEEPPSPEKGQLAVVSVPPKSTTDFGTLPWISPNLRFGGKSISAGCLAAQESKPMVEAR